MPTIRSLLYSDTHFLQWQMIQETIDYDDIVVRLFLLKLVKLKYCLFIKIGYNKAVSYT